MGRPQASFHFSRLAEAGFGVLCAGALIGLPNHAIAFDPAMDHTCVWNCYGPSERRTITIWIEPPPRLRCGLTLGDRSSKCHGRFRSPRASLLSGRRLIVVKAATACAAAISSRYILRARSLGGTRTKRCRQLDDRFPAGDAERVVSEHGCHDRLSRCL
jgi:hypothetical protein